MKTVRMLEYFTSKGFIVKPEVKFTGDTFTVSVATLSRDNGKKKKVILQGEGIARRSYTQVYDLQIGTDTATNRAIEALYKKFNRKSRRIQTLFEG